MQLESFFSMVRPFFRKEIAFLRLPSVLYPFFHAVHNRENQIINESVLFDKSIFIAVHLNDA